MSSKQVTDRVNQFVRDLEDIVRAEALAAVQRVLGGMTGAPLPPAARAAATRAPRAAKPSKAAPKAAAKPAAKATAGDDKVVAYVKQHPGSRLEVIAKGIGVASPKLKARVAELVSSKALRKEGKTRGTTYFAV